MLSIFGQSIYQKNKSKNILLYPKYLYFRHKLNKGLYNIRYIGIIAILFYFNINSSNKIKIAYYIIINYLFYSIKSILKYPKYI